MKEFLKAAAVAKSAALDDAELALINAQTLRELTAEEVFAFRLVACDTKVDRDNECFSAEALEQMAPLYVGKPVLMDHRWAAGSQTARVYAAAVEDMGEYKRLVLRCYMPRTDGTAETIAALEGGVLRECSVGLCIRSAVCNVCGADQMVTRCKHRPGVTYDGVECHFTLGDVCDVYEVSLVAVPAQPDAGTTKSKRYGGQEPPEDGDHDDPCAKSLRLRLRVAEARAKAAGSGQNM